MGDRSSGSRHEDEEKDDSSSKLAKIDIPTPSILKEVPNQNQGYAEIQRVNLGCRSPSFRPQARRTLSLPEGMGEDINVSPTYRVLPIFSGIVVPFAILLAIPSLTDRWYIRTGENHVIIDSKPNSWLLIAGTTISMVCAVLASGCLVVRFAERAIKPMTLLAIAFLIVHDLISATTVTVFGVIYSVDDGFTYGQPFWMTVCSTIASIITSVTLLVDFIRTKNFSSSGSGLTRRQRTLVIIIMVLLFYIAFGALVQKLILKLTFIDAIYFAVVSIETLGFGDVVPSTTGSRIFTMFYITFGILNLAVAVASVREVLLESIVVSLQARIYAIKQRERQRRVRGRWRDAVRWRLKAQRLPVWIDRPTQVPGNSSLRWIRDTVRKALSAIGLRPIHTRLHHRRLNIEALTTAQLEASAMEAGVPLAELLPPGFVPFDSDPATWTPITPSAPDDGELSAPSPLTHIRTGRMVHLLASFALAVTHGEQAMLLGAHPDPTYADDDDESPEGSTAARSWSGIPFSAASTLDSASLSTVLEEEETLAFRVRLAAALILFLIFWMVGSAIFSRTEGWSFWIALWFCFTTFTTVGYGDFTPKTAAGRSIFIVWALMGIGTMTILIAILSEAYSDRYKRVIQTQVYEKVIRGVPLTNSATISASPIANNSLTDLRTPAGNTDEKQPFPGRPRAVSFAGLPPLSEKGEIGANAAPDLRKRVNGKSKLKPPSLNLESIVVQAGNRPFHDEVIGHVQDIQALLLTLPTDVMSQTTLTGIDRHLMEITNLMTVKALAS